VVSARSEAEKAGSSERPRPLFLFLHTYDVHEPARVPAPYWRLFSGRNFQEVRADLGFRPFPKQLNRPSRLVSPEDRRAIRLLFDNGVRAADALVGKLIRLLQEHDLYEDAIFVVLSDHGEEYSQHGRYGHGHAVYDEVIHVPLILRAPQGRAAGRLISASTALVDVAPTVLELAGLPVPSEFQGRSLVGLINDTIDPQRFEDRAILFVSSDAHGDSGMKKGRWKVVTGRGHGDELYDLWSDPRESVDLAPESDSLARRLGDELSRWMAEMEKTGEDNGWFSQPQEGDALSDEVREQLRALGYVD
jgi:arylsulfatase A-like enzyme